MHKIDKLNHQNMNRHLAQLLTRLVHQQRLPGSRLLAGTSRLLTLLLTLLAALSSASASAGVVLLYHHVSDKTPAITSVSPELFNRHLDIIEEEGFTVLPLEELLELSLDPASYDPAARHVALTFDDAYQSIYTNAWPQLRARNWPFTIFVATDQVKNNSSLYLSWAQLDEMSKAGVTLANHTLSHAHLVRRLEGETSAQWQARVAAEIDQAGEVLAARGYDNQLFAWPYGEYNLALLQLLAERGLTGFGQQSGAIGPESNQTILPRFPMGGVYASEAGFRNKLGSLALPIEFPLIEPLAETARPEVQLRLHDGGPSKSVKSKNVESKDVRDKDVNGKDVKSKDVNGKTASSMTASNKAARSKIRLANLNCFVPGGKAVMSKPDPASMEVENAATEAASAGAAAANPEAASTGASRNQASQAVILGTDADLPVGRSRYNCTLWSEYKLGKLPRYYWFSQLWMTKNKDGSWWQE